MNTSYSAMQAHCRQVEHFLLEREGMWLEMLPVPCSNYLNYINYLSAD